MRVNVVVNKGLYAMLPLLVSLLIWASCKSDGVGPAVVGRWQQVKLHIYQVDNGSIAYDTTYLHPFTNADFIQFFGNGTCTIGNDHYYYPNILNYPKTPQLIPAITSTMNYSASGIFYLLTPQSTITNPGGFVSTDTVSVSNTGILLLHSVFYTHVPGIISVSDSYYQK